MSLTRNQRKMKRDRLAYAFTFAIVMMALLAYIFIFATTVVHNKEVDETTKAQPSVTVSSGATATQFVTPVESIPVVIVEDEADELEIEAQMPEFGYNYEYVVGVVAAECRGEPYEGQLAVAQCIRTTAERRMLTPEEVVKLPNRYASPCTNSSDLDLVRDACCDTFVHGVSATDEPIEYFYSTRGGYVSNWHENNLEFVMEIGNHRFFKER